MYYYLNGALALLEPSKAVIDCGGVGYLVFITQKTYDSLAKSGALSASGESTGLMVKLLTHYVVREDAAELYGFYTENECSLFKMLIAISGVGPKAALAILSVLSPEALIMAVTAQDAKAIAKAQGIGLKTAQKIILELKDKLTSFNVSLDESFVPETEPDDTDAVKEAISALVTLGYTRGEAQNAIRKATGTTVEELIRSALNKLM